MDVAALIGCESRACVDVDLGRYALPGPLARPDDVTIVMVSEAPPPAGHEALYAETTVQAFRDADEPVECLEDVVELGVYLTTAVKCAKTGYGLSTPTIRACSVLLEEELGLFPLARVLMLMGDVAIKSVNAISRRSGEPRVVPAGATYKLRGGDYAFRGMKVFPSYVQAGPSFLIERSKRRMIAEDIAAALAYVRAG